ncbi:UDP-glucuronate 4-epimerase 4 [Galdieria sulphuraria]|uniref:NAD-dependent epimerase/dehydratase n=1 Tax=Galdieria sulphuraria TaxID=130081 RepID=M2Y026_GALSU|nr:NAD-dependent epimerase/dehydratase [Galdieria sulphuraria]EME29238.1 NAD-dependent epimerase/dehydratase [Galdieria sulphuraria]GJD11389.1 UDP-glucuronate 4-epimerase 4 [Galdieria sulphuraria]|eukprot:XP_005705758.1 NAD-dependent epimerase/dehydratase [Galdieria sulphuraria]
MFTGIHNSLHCFANMDSFIIGKTKWCHNRNSRVKVLSRTVWLLSTGSQSTTQRRRVLVTGAAGFIGFHAAKSLSQLGDLVVGVDNFNDYYDENLKRLRAQVLLHQFGITLQDMDITDQKALELLIGEYQFTHVLHLAAQAGVQYSLVNPVSYTSSNVQGFVSLLEALKNICVAMKWDFPIIVYASSSSVYGKNKKVPFCEIDPVTAPANLYAVTKISNELLAQVYHHLYGFKLTGLRYFTVYGAWGRPDMSYYLFAEAIHEQRELFLYQTEEPVLTINSGSVMEPCRDFTHVGDIVKGTIAALHKGHDLELINLGNCYPQRISYMVQCLEDLLGRKAIIKYRPLPKGDVPCTYADITKARQLLDFEPQVDLKEGLKDFCEWFIRWKQWKANLLSVM